MKIREQEASLAEILYEKKGYYLEKAILSYFDQILVKQEVIHPKKVKYYSLLP